MECAIVINVGPKAHSYPRGPLGVFVVPAATKDGPGILVVRPVGEIQDVGGKIRKRNDLIPARRIAEDIMLQRAEERGLLICEAAPDVPKSLEKAEYDERDFLTQNPGDLSHRVNPLTKIREFTTKYDPEVRDRMIKLSRRVQDERTKFDADCLKLVTKKEIATAEGNRTAYLQRLCKEGDRLWAREQTRGEVNEHHKDAAVEMGYEPPWAYTPAVNQDCPACGQKIKKGVAICAHCNAVIDDAAARKYKVGPYANVREKATA